MQTEKAVVMAMGVRVVKARRLIVKPLSENELGEYKKAALVNRHTYVQSFYLLPSFLSLIQTQLAQPPHDTHTLTGSRPWPSQASSPDCVST